MAVISISIHFDESKDLPAGPYVQSGSTGALEAHITKDFTLDQFEVFVEKYQWNAVEEAIKLRPPGVREIFNWAANSLTHTHRAKRFSPTSLT